MAVAVVINKRAACAVARCRMQQPGLSGHVREGPVTVVAIKAVLSVISKEEIFKAVVVVIAYANSLRPACIQQAGFGSHICKCAVAVVLVEPVAGVGRSVLKSTPTKDEDIHPTIVVVIEEGAARGHGLDNVGEVINITVHHGLVQARSVSHIHKAGKRRCRLFCRNRRPKNTGQQSGSDYC